MPDWISQLPTVNIRPGTFLNKILLLLKVLKQLAVKRSDDIQRKDTQHNDIQHHDTQQHLAEMTPIIDDSQHNNNLSLCWVSLFIYCYAECRSAECHIQALYAQCHYADCHYTECPGANKTIITLSQYPKQILMVKSGHL
jgi:hypothetical protein